MDGKKQCPVNSKRTTLIGIMIFSVLCITVLQSAMRYNRFDPVPGSCTIFTASIGDKVLFGNNEDYYKPKTYLWTEPATEENYGSVYLGFKDYSHQGGINEKGLCFDANALPKSRINLHSELELPPQYEAPYEDFEIWLPVLILRKAATVKEAIAIANKYQRTNWYPDAGAIKYQLHFADAIGDAVVISVDESGELVFTRKAEGEDFLISTNFNKVNPANAFAYPCERYNITKEMLEEIDSEDELSADFGKAVLDAVHQKGIFSGTLYSNIFDLKDGILYLYHWHQFDEVVVLNVEEELAKEKYLVRVKDLFSKETAGNAKSEYIVTIVLWSLAWILGTVFIIALLHYIRNGKLKHRV